VDLAYPELEYQDLWRSLNPNQPVPAGYLPKALLMPREARRFGFRIVRIGLVSASYNLSSFRPEESYVHRNVIWIKLRLRNRFPALKADGGYVLASVTHSSKIPREEK
jgi:hypothetical protein